MKNRTRHSGKLEIIERLPNSYYGNPRYRLRIDGFSCVTKVDSSHAYSLPNHNGKYVRAIIGTHYGLPTLDSLWPN